MCKVRFIWKFIAVVFFLTPTMEVFAGNTATKDMYNPPDSKMKSQYDYVVYLVGGPNTNQYGMQNLKNYLKLKFRSEHLYSSIYTIYPYADGTIEKDIRVSFEQDEDGRLGAMEILRDMLRQNSGRAKKLAREDDSRLCPRTYWDDLDDKNPIIIAHGLAGKAAIRAVEMLPRYFDHYIKNLILVGTPRMPLSMSIYISKRTIYVHDVEDPITNIGTWGENSKFRPKHVHAKLVKPEEVVLVIPKEATFSKKNKSKFKSNGFKISAKDKEELHVDYSSGKPLCTATTSSSTSTKVRNPLPDYMEKFAEASGLYAEVERKKEKKAQTVFSLEKPFELEEEPMVELNNSYFFKGKYYTDIHGKTNLEKTINSFFDHLRVNGRKGRSESAKHTAAGWAAAPFVLAESAVTLPIMAGAMLMGVDGPDSIKTLDKFDKWTEGTISSKEYEKQKKMDEERSKFMKYEKL